MRMRMESMNHSDCNGCGGCYAICPSNAISMVYDHEGFQKAKVNGELCTGCNKCTAVCGKNVQEDDLVAFNLCTEYYAYSKDAVTVRKSASGALAYELSRTAIANGYKVYGVYYDENNHNAVAGIADTVEKLEAFRGSKYIEASYAEAFRHVLNDRAKYLVIATPCLVWEMAKALELIGRRDEFILVDFVCHGTPPTKLWHRYLEQYGKPTDLANISFRAPESGWHTMAIGITVKGTKILSPRKTDAFFQLFDTGVYKKRSCYGCKLKNAYGISDIRLGDAWGDEFADNNDGVSRVILGSKRGEKLFDLTKERIRYGIPQKRISMPPNRKEKIYESVRKQIARDLSSGIPIDKILVRYKRAYPLKTKLANLIPNSIIRRIRNG